MNRLPSHVRPTDPAPRRLDSLRTYEKALRALDQGLDDVHTPLDVLLASCASMRRTALDSLVPEATASLVRGDEAQTLRLLNFLAQQEPDHAALRPRPPLAVSEVQTSQAIAEFIDRLLHADAWPDGSLNDLRAALGVNCFRYGISPGACLLASVNWARVRQPRYFLASFSLLYWGGLADTAGRMARGLVRNRHLGQPHDADVRLDLGEACTYSGLPDKARTLLEPLLPQNHADPSKLFRILDALRMAGCSSFLRRHLRSPGMLDATRSVLDAPQNLRLTETLAGLGMHKEAAMGYHALCAEMDSAISNQIPQIVSGLAALAKTSRTRGLLRRLSKAAAEQDPMTHAEALVAMGRAEDARSALDAIVLKPDAPLPAALKLFGLRDSLSQPDRMREMFPTLLELAGGDRDTETHVRLSLAFYEDTLEQELDFVLERFPMKGASRQFLSQVASALFWLGRFAETGRVLRDKALGGRGPLELQTLNMRRHHALATGRIRQAARLMELFSLQSRWAPYSCLNQQILAVHDFEHALLLRHRGNARGALRLVRRNSRMYKAPNNPCRALAALLAREMDGRSATMREAAMVETIADTLCRPKSPCQGLLYLHAARLREELGQECEKVRILNQKLARTVFLNPGRRESLPEISNLPLLKLRDQIQAMFFPRFRGTFWNRILDGFIPGGERSSRTERREV